MNRPATHVRAAPVVSATGPRGPCPRQDPPPFSHAGVAARSFAKKIMRRWRNLGNRERVPPAMWGSSGRSNGQSRQRISGRGTGSGGAPGDRPCLRPQARRIAISRRTASEPRLCPCQPTLAGMPQPQPRREPMAARMLVMRQSQDKNLRPCFISCKMARATTWSTDMSRTIFDEPMPYRPPMNRSTTGLPRS